MGLFDKLKKKNTEGAEETAETVSASEGNELTRMAELYNEDNNDTNFITLLAVLRKTETWVPMMETEIGAMPYILEAGDGTQFYPIFSEENQIPSEYAENLTWAQVPFEASARYIMESTEVNDMLLNAFTKSVVIPEESVRVLMNENASEHAVSSDTLKLFPAGDDGEAAEIRKKAYAFLSGRKDVKKAYFAKLLNGVEMSYIFIVEAEGDTQSMFKGLFEAVGETEVSMPIDYTLYPSLKEQLEEIECEPFFAL